MKGTGDRNLRTVALCLVAWVLMGLVSFVHNAAAATLDQVPPSASASCEVAATCHG